MFRRLRLLDWILLGGLAVGWVLALSIYFRYPGSVESRGPHLGSLAFALAAFLGSGAVAVYLAQLTSGAHDRADVRLGILTGFVTGCLWIFEISFNNFVDPSFSTGSARYIVDNSVWGLVALTILVVSGVRSWHTGRSIAGIHVGLASGLVSGLLASLMGLLLVLVWMPFLLHDPLNIQEYAARGAVDEPAGMAAYFAYETLGGAILHLTVLGIIMGSALGGLAGALAPLSTRFLKKPPNSMP